MTDRMIVVFRSRLRDGVEADYGRDAERIAELAVAAPGFASAKDFIADDGERLALIEWNGAAELARWREQVEHVGAQQRGRERYYASYRLQICRELRGSAFDAATGAIVRGDRDPARLRAIAERWLACFTQRDLDGLLALYADDAMHTSPKIRARDPGTHGVLRGKSALRAWWRDAFERLPSMRYDATAIVADEHRVVMEYVRRVDGEPDLPVAETLDVENGLIVASRVFHG
jgi:heme-degrading monooxygenase HmoA/ketosteroid isomerase-like protein